MDQFFQQFKNRKYKKAEILIKAGQEPEGLFYLKDGVVRQYAISNNGEELTINTFKPGAIFPVSWIINDSISSHYFEAVTATTVWIAPKKEALAFLQNNPQILFDLVQRIYRGLDGYFLRMEQQMLGSAQAKLIAELLIYARRFGQQDGDKVIVKLKITEKDLAAQSGIARETVSREIQKLRQKELISFSRRTLIIHNLAKLEEELLNP